MGLFDEATQIVRMRMAAGVAPEQLAASRVELRHEGPETFFIQIPRPIGEEAGRVFRQARGK